MANVRIQLDLTMPSAVLRTLLTAALLVGCAADLVSENVTLNTYYPAPSGVYTQMITTNNSYLARDGGSVGIFTANPQRKLDVNGNGRFQASLEVGTWQTVGGNMTISGSETVAGNSSVGGWQTVGSNQTVGGNLQVNGSANVNGNETVADISTVNGRYLHIAAGGPGCGGSWRNGDIWNSLCPGGQYATFTPGLYVDGWSYQARGGTDINSTGEAYILCCPK